jgi:hypothetical protein
MHEARTASRAQPLGTDLRRVDEQERDDTARRGEHCLRKSTCAR